MFRSKKATGDCVGEKASTIALQFTEEILFVFLNSSSGPALTQIPDLVLLYFCINCLFAGSGNALFLCFFTHLDTPELVIVKTCCTQTQRVCPPSPEPEGASVPSMLDSDCVAADVCLCVCVSLCLCVRKRVLMRSRMRQRRLHYVSQHDVSPPLSYTEMHTCLNKCSVSPSLLYQDFIWRRGGPSHGNTDFSLLLCDFIFWLWTFSLALDCGSCR